MNARFRPDPGAVELWRPAPADAAAPVNLGRLDALGRGALLATAADILAALPAPEAQACAELIRSALESHIRRGEPFARALGIEPPAGLTLRRAALQAERNQLLHIARASKPEWRTASAQRAAKLVRLAFRRYRGSVWPRERAERDTAPAVEPQASFWRLARIEAEGGPKVPGRARVAQIYELADGPQARPEQLLLL